MTQNIIITCGTSQLDDEKTGIIGTDLRTDLERWDNRGSQPSDETWTAHQGLLNYFLNHLHEEEQWIHCRENGHNNPYGAEIATLVKLQDRGGGAGWDPAQDRLVILSSQTCKGYISARLLRELLISQFHAENVVGPVIVEGLKELPESERAADNALLGFAETVKTYIDPNNPGRPPNSRDLFVATGGFKAVLPCLSLYSLIMGIEMVYLFEQSNYLHTLYPPINFNRQQKEQWQGAFIELRRMIPEGERNRSMLEVILSARQDFPMPTF